MLGRILELLVLDQLAHQVPTRVVLLFLHLRALFLGEQEPAFDHHEGRGHHEEIAGEIEVQHAHHVEVVHVLVGDADDGDVVHVDLLFLDQVQEEVERTLEDFELDTVFFGSRHGSVQGVEAFNPAPPRVLPRSGSR